MAKLLHALHRVAAQRSERIFPLTSESFGSATQGKVRHQFPPKGEQDFRNVSESRISLFYPVWPGMIPNQTCPGSGEVPLGEAAWLGMEPNLWLFPTV